jgi:E3 ubiquitin-protein ligase UBR7
MPSTSPCTLRTDPATGTKGVHCQEAAKDNQYNHNFQNLFCGCGEEYDVHREKGTMYQCLGLGSTETGGCGEDWWHPECLLGLPRDWASRKEDKSATENPPNGDDQDSVKEEQEVPPGFPSEDEFESIICYKCVMSNPWIKQYAGTPGFLPPVFKQGSNKAEEQAQHQDVCKNLKRKAADDDNGIQESNSKRVRGEQDDDMTATEATTECNSNGNAPVHKHNSLPPAPDGIFSLFLKEDFREHLCHCPKCYSNLLPHQQLVEEEETYQPSLSDSEASDAGPGSGTRSHGTGSLLERGEAALSGVDRVRAIEGVMVYNHLKDKVKEFLKPYAESGKPVGAEDIKAYFEKLRGDEAAIKEAGSRPLVSGEDNDKAEENRREQKGF